MKKPGYSLLNSYWIIALLIFTLVTSCSKDDNEFKAPESPEEEITSTQAIQEIMQEWYLWNDQLPDISPEQFSSDEAYFDALLAPQDRWSFIEDLDIIRQFLKSGTYSGYGFMVKFDAQNDLRIKLVYDESPLTQEGIKRGWKLININNQNISSLSSSEIINELNKTSNTFVFESNTGEKKELALSQEVMNQNTVLHKQLIELSEKKIAYLVFNSFLGSSETELNEAFSELQDANELILDLRYNGGGSNNISIQLASMISGNAYTDMVYSKATHNRDKAGQNFIELFSRQENILNLNRVIVITTSSTASASEMVINGLKPYMDVTLIGSTTNGKPVGMYVFELEELNLAILPISFKLSNSNDEGEYFGGIPVDYNIIDDLTHDFGDLEEANLKAALDYILNDTFDPSIALKAGITPGRELPLKGFRELVGAF